MVALAALAGVETLTDRAPSEVEILSYWAPFVMDVPVALDEWMRGNTGCEGTKRAATRSG